VWRPAAGSWSVVVQFEVWGCFPQIYKRDCFQGSSRKLQTRLFSEDLVKLEFGSTELLVECNVFSCCKFDMLIFTQVSMENHTLRVLVHQKLLLVKLSHLEIIV
jgi:hypothetical protein